MQSDPCRDWNKEQQLAVKNAVSRYLPFLRLLHIPHKRCVKREADSNNAPIDAMIYRHLQVVATGWFSVSELFVWSQVGIRSTELRRALSASEAEEVKQALASSGLLPDIDLEKLFGVAKRLSWNGDNRPDDVFCGYRFLCSL